MNVFLVSCHTVSNASLRHSWCSRWSLNVVMVVRPWVSHLGDRLRPGCAQGGGGGSKDGGRKAAKASQGRQPGGANRESLIARWLLTSFPSLCTLFTSRAHCTFLQVGSGLLIVRITQPPAPSLPSSPLPRNQPVALAHFASPPSSSSNIPPPPSPS